MICNRWNLSEEDNNGWRKFGHKSKMIKKPDKAFEIQDRM